jgi:hypothetical protein
VDVGSLDVVLWVDERLSVSQVSWSGFGSASSLARLAVPYAAGSIVGVVPQRDRWVWYIARHLVDVSRPCWWTCGRQCAVLAVSR